ncbi:hypothetical protein GR925_21220 [Streptomyces sp. HUCO-GS316]|uniref:hypothetical protein n=1 Tax=Streptomyces sp. HUCO-GS316 TaxID=2692198 RepID=UPI00136E48F2|nr:hypothetical protein [Streptomyces sp. HUCO-GS316]MXM65900.1 hypothetical protein [Streptomyces sp. HUCO-GS316]
MAWAAKWAPTTNRSIGPNVGAARDPAQYGLGTDASSAADTPGAAEPGTEVTDERTRPGQERQGVDVDAIAGGSQHVMGTHPRGPPHRRRR